MSFLDDLGDLASVAFFPVAVTRAAYGMAKDALFPGSPPPLGKIPAPPPPPDPTDVAVRQARLSARRRALGGAGLSSTFLSGPLGDLLAPSTYAPRAGGI